MTNGKVCVRVPASTANLGPGFDTLGMALDLHAWVEMSLAADDTKIELIGDQLGGISASKSNLIYEVAQQVFERAGVSHPELDIAIYSEIPLTRGLGSSASAIIGGMLAANALIGDALSKDEIFQMATRMENHPDNVGASLFGGIVIASWDGTEAKVIRITPDPRLKVLVIIPDFQLPTEKARHILPQQVSLQDAVYNTSRSSLLTAALLSGDLGTIRFAMKDVLHQPYRASLIPGMAQILEQACNYGALGAALSGAGPSLLALVDGSRPGDYQRLESFMLKTLANNGVKAQAVWMKPSSEGAVILTPDGEHSTFIDEIKLRRGEVR